MTDQAIIDAIMQGVSLPAIVGRRVKLTKRGRLYSGLCPFHNEKTPSFAVYDDGRYQCFGCGARGSAIDFVRHFDGLSMQQAVMALAAEAGISQGIGLPMISDAERARIKARADKDEADRKRKTERDQRDAAKRARRIWAAAGEVRDHPYLSRKRVPSYGLRTDTYYRYIDGNTVPIPDALYVPVFSGPNIIASLQAIFLGTDNPLGRDRDFLPGGRRDGCYYRIGRPNGVVIVCEGYSTGASIHLATGHCVMVAFTRGNLLAVALVVRRALPCTRIVLAADDDLWTGGNPGMTDATVAAAAVNGIVAAPRFSCLDGKPTDFNDLMILDGLDAVRAQIEGAISA